MLAAAAIACALMMALFVYQHRRIAGQERARSVAAVRPVRQPARPLPATLYRDGGPHRTDWTKPEAYDPVPLHEFGWSEPRVRRDGGASA